MPPTDMEFRLNSEAMGAAAAMREQGVDGINVARLHRLARADAENLLAKWRQEAKGGSSMTVALHLDERALAGAIFRHAMLHAGAFINVDTNKPYDQCPRCGSELMWPGR